MTMFRWSVLLMIGILSFQGFSFILGALSILYAGICVYQLKTGDF